MPVKRGLSIKKQLGMDEFQLHEYNEFKKSQLESFYPNGTIVCEPDHFGEWSVPDVDTLYDCKKEGNRLLKLHEKHGWSARKVARKVAEKFKLKKYTGYKDPPDKYNEPTKFAQ